MVFCFSFDFAIVAVANVICYFIFVDVTVVFYIFFGFDFVVDFVSYFI